DGSGRARTSAAGEVAGVRARGQRGAGDAPEVVAGRNAVLEALRAVVPATALYAGPRLDVDDRVREAIALAAQTGIPMIEAGPAVGAGHGGRVEGVGRGACPGAGRAGAEPGPGARLLPGRGPVRGRPGRRRSGRRRRPGGGRRAAGPRGRVRRTWAVAPGGAALRPAGPNPHGGRR